MGKKDIKTRDDIFKLVSTFYAKVRLNEILAPFFDRIDDWEEHFERLTNFWESSLFLKTKYLGDPLVAHAKADREHGNKISELHFGVWLNLWFETIEELFEGETAENAKRRARKMGTFLYMQIFKARQNS
ncbi:group III truncated hemoglobin [Flavobacteriaceae bacterium S0862]|nr:group III truncated hemoglobin [Flavobacteriaceae bacterium S0862]